MNFRLEELALFRKLCNIPKPLYSKDDVVIYEGREFSITKRKFDTWNYVLGPENRAWVYEGIRKREESRLFGNNMTTIEQTIEDISEEKIDFAPEFALNTPRSRQVYAFGK